MNGAAYNRSKARGYLEKAKAVIFSQNKRGMSENPKLARELYNVFKEANHAENGCH